MSTRREINGNNPHNNKRRTNRDRRHTGPANFKCNNPPYNNFDTMSNNYSCYPNNQTMFPAVSDPSLCYPYMSYQMPLEPLSLPTFNLYQPFYRNHSCGLLNNPPMNFVKPPESDQEYTSLPCVNNDLSDSDNKRRFSDPGIPNDCDIEDGKSDIVRSLVEQVNYLKDSNRRLCRELQEMRSEMNFLKQQFGGRYYDKDYEPGMLSDIVREIRDAARVREEALLSRVKHMIEERQLSMNHIHMVTEKTRNNDRLGKLEEQMKTLCLNNSLREDMSGDTSAATDQVLELEQVNLGLRRELQEARAGKKDADAKANHLDQLLRSLQHQKYDNGEFLASNDEVKAPTTTTTSSIDNCSLTTKSASPVARVVMSGPVTSL